MINQTTLQVTEVQKALGFKGTLKYAAVDNETEVLVSVAVAKADFLKALRLSGELTEIKTEAGENDGIQTVIVTSVGEIAAPAKRGRKPKNQ